MNQPELANRKHLIVAKGLIIRKEWLDKILNNGKHWEMRSTHTKQRGIIKLIEAEVDML